MSDAKERILHASIEEFGANGYDKASTNHIMEKASVSKGLIFHHYGCKSTLYMACVQHIVDIYLDGYYKAYELAEKDCFKRLDMAVAYKTKFFIENPVWGNLMLDVNRLAPEDTIPELTKYMDEIRAKIYAMMTADLDLSSYRKDIPAEKIIDFIWLVMETYANRYNFKDITYEKTIQLIDTYRQEMEIVKDMIFNGVYEG